MAIKIQATKKGNAVGFTARGETVTVRYFGKRKAWQVNVCGDYGPSLTDARTQSFATLSEAKTYALSLICEETTLQLAWWPVEIAA